MKRLFASASVVATLIFSVAIFALFFLAPEIDPLRSGISFYALTGYRLVIGLAFILVGVSGILLGIALWPTIESSSGKIGLVLLIAWGFTSILAGAFPLDAPGAAPTLSGSIHNLAGLNFLLVAAALPLIDQTSQSGFNSKPARPATYWLAWFGLIFALLLFIFNGPLASLGIGGLVQRLYWLILALWLLIKAQHVLRAVR